MNEMNNNYDSNTNKYSTNYNKTTTSYSTTTNTLSKTNSANLNPQNSSLTLYKGMNFKGTITDIRQKEVTIQLDDGSKLNAKLSNPSSLTIGEKAEFIVQYQNEQTIGIEIVQISQSNQSEPTINKALLSSNLPINEKNQTIVKELLDNNMSIDKQSIINILKDSYQHPDVAINTLVLLNKYKLPITEETLNQFEQYRNLEHRIMNGITSFSKEMPIILEKLMNDGNMNHVHSFHNQLTNLLLKDQAITYNTIQERLANSNFSSKEISTFQNLEGILKEATSINNTTSPNQLEELKEVLFHNSNTYLSEETKTLTTTLFSKEERTDLINLLNESSLTKPEKDAILDGSFKLSSLLSYMEETLTQTDHKDLLLTSSLFHKVLETVRFSLNEQNTLSSILNKEECGNLYDAIKELPRSEELSNEIKNGSLTNKETLSFIKSLLSSADDNSILHVLDSKEYQKLIKESLTLNWSLTPKLLKEEQSVEKLYQTLQNDIEDLNQFLQSTNLAKEQGASTIHNMKENLDFMKALNEMFTYVQLPIRLKNQNIHSDLYIYTDKKTLKDKKDNISVLLHLDMEHLGPTDIHLTLMGSNIQAKFYLSDIDSKALVDENINRLETALESKGYSLSSEINMREKEVNLVDDLLEQNKPATSIKRYSFDIRT